MMYGGGEALFALVKAKVKTTGKTKQLENYQSTGIGVYLSCLTMRTCPGVLESLDMGH